MDTMDAIANVLNGTDDPLKDLGEVIWDKLKTRKYEEALKEAKDEKYKEYLFHNSLDLVPIILKIIEEGIEPEGEKCVEDLLVYVASAANRKEALITLLEQLELSPSASHFRVLLPPLQTLLLREVTEKTRPILFSWVFNSLYSHVAIMALPDHYNLEGDERKLLDLDMKVQSFTQTLQWVTDFYQAFYDKVMSGDLVWGGKVKSSRDYLAYFLLQFFHKPISYLDIYCKEGEVENALFRVCNKLSNMIAHLLGNSFKLLDLVKWNWSKTVLATADSEHDESQNGSDDEIRDFEGMNKSEDGAESDKGDQKEAEKEPVSQLSLGCYYYCTLGQNMAHEFVPCVHSPSYIFISCLPLIAYLLQEKEAVAIHKGLVLAKMLLKNLSEKSLSNECLEARAHASFPQLLIKIMIFSENKELRTTALDIFRPYLKKFELTGRRNLMKSLLISVKHAGVLGLVIHELKENVAQCLKEEEMNINFLGRNVEELILLSCTLPSGETTDLLEWSDYIMAALNLLIFLFVCDKDDVTGIRKLLPTIQKQFLDCLQTGLDLSRAHYELKLKELSVPGKKKGADLSVHVAGVTLPNIPPDQEKNIIQTALCSFDMMQCVLARALQAAEGKI